jgi:hypothetical protein
MASETASHRNGKGGCVDHPQCARYRHGMAGNALKRSGPVRCGTSAAYDADAIEPVDSKAFGFNACRRQTAMRPIEIDGSAIHRVTGRGRLA